MKQVIGCGFNRGSKRSERTIFLKTFYTSTMADDSLVHFPYPLIPELRVTGVCGGPSYL